MIPINAEELMRATGSTRGNADLYLPFIQGTCKAYEINTQRRVAGFLSQIGHESGGMSRLEESMNYSVAGLARFVRWGRISVLDAAKYGRAPGRPANQEMIANIVYGGDWGLKKLGNIKFGDGWKYRGRGLKQLTGLDNYRRCGHAIGENLVDHPERLLMPVNAALSAGWFWSTNNLNHLADIGDVRAMTIRVNGGTTALKERTALWNEGLKVFA